MKYFATLAGEQFEIDLTESGDLAHLEMNGEKVTVDLKRIDSRETFSILVDNAAYEVIIARANGGFEITVGGESYPIEVLDEREAMSAQLLGDPGESKGDEIICSVMPGIVTSVLVEVGQTLEANQPVLTIEAMKMENEVRVKTEGIVAEIFVDKGQTVAAGTELVLVRPMEGPPLDSFTAIHPDAEPESNF